MRMFACDSQEGIHHVARLLWPEDQVLVFHEKNIVRRVAVNVLDNRELTAQGFDAFANALLPKDLAEQR